MKKIFSLFLCVVLFGCFSTPDSSFYMLRSMDDQVLSQKKVSVSIYNIIIPEYVDKPQIVLQQPELAELKVSEFNRWGDELGEMLKNTFIDNLSAMLPNSQVNALMYGINSRYIIKIKVEKFSGWLQKNAILKVQWQILNANGKVIFSDVKEYIKNAGKSYDSYVMAQSKLWQKFTYDVAVKLASL